MPMFHSVSGLARHFGVAPRKISDLFYARRLDDERCPVIDGRRIIPADYVPTVEAALHDAGELPQLSMKNATGEPRDVNQQ